MKLHRYVAAGLIAAAVPVAVAGAASPTPGQPYIAKVKKANSAKAPTILLEVNSKGSKLNATLDCGDEGSYALKNVPIDSDGAFAKDGKIKGAPFAIDGVFKSARKATGGLDTVICFVGDSATFTAKVADV